MPSLVFASPNGVDISLDYMIPSDATSDQPAPVLVWFHGGGLIQGTRTTPPPHIRSSPSNHSLGLVTLDYRLAPQTRLPSILSDVAAGLAFLHSPAFHGATQGRLDVSKMIISGSSAGGWLALIAGWGVAFEACGLVKPEKPLAVCAIYPITGLEDPFWTTQQRPASFSTKTIPHADMAPFLDPQGPEISFNAPESPRQSFYQYMVQEGILRDLLLSPDPDPPSSTFNISQTLLHSTQDPSTLPPTLLMHGTHDRYVPIQQSYDVRNAARTMLRVGGGAGAGADGDDDHDGLVQLEVVQGKDHGYDFDDEEKMERMYGFIRKVLDGQGGQSRL